LPQCMGFDTRTLFLFGCLAGPFFAILQLSMLTRRFLLCCFVGTIGHWLGFARLAPANQQTATLNETLRSVLKCRREEEFAFVNLVATKVEQGALPLSLVLSMMKWAQERRPDLPFPYFQEGIKRRAAAIGVEL
jgi:hypothetical protein